MKKFTVTQVPCSARPIVFEDSLCVGCNRCADVCRLIARTVSGLTAQGVDAADRVILVLPTSRDFLSVYLGCLHAGVVPVVAAEPTTGGMTRGRSMTGRTAASGRAVER